ncbi:MAG: hypothetical protein AAGD07_02570 [Planctomycetota bacterium]
MSDDELIPKSYAQWRQCIEVRAKLKLTPSYINERLSELEDGEHTRTQEFAKLYGASQLEQTIQWFRRALEDR